MHSGTGERKGLCDWTWVRREEGVLSGNLGQRRGGGWGEERMWQVVVT